MQHYFDGFSPYENVPIIMLKDKNSDNLMPRLDQLVYFQYEFNRMPKKL